MEPTTTITIPIAVYAYQRHKQPTDPYAVKRIGFYDKRKVKEETKFQNYYVRAKAMPSKAVFKEEQMYLINRDNALVAAKLKFPPKKGEKPKQQNQKIEKLKKSDGNLIHEAKYINKKTKILNDDDTRTDVYIPVKYFQANATQVTQKLEGLLAYSETWHLYNGNHKNIDIFYLPKTVQWNEYASYQTERKIVYPIDEDKDGEISSRDGEKGLVASLKLNELKWFDCEDVEGKYLAISHGVVSSFLLSFLWHHRGATAAFFLGSFGERAIQSLLQFLQSFSKSYEDSRMNFGFGSWGPAVASKAWEMLPIIKTEDKAVFVAWISRIYASSGQEVVEQSNFMTYLEQVGDMLLTLQESAMYVLEAIYSILEPYITAILTAFSQFVNNGPTVLATGEAEGFIKQAGVTLLNLSGANSYINILLFILGLIEGKYDTQMGRILFKAYKDIVCFVAKFMKYGIQGISSICDFINPFLGREHKKLVLKGFQYWDLAKIELNKYAKDQKIKLRFLHEKEERPRFVMQTKAEKRTIYNQINTRPKSSVIINEEGIPYVYVVAEGLKETGDEYWYFYMYDYDKDDDGWIFAVYETDKTFNKKKILSSPIPIEAGGEWCSKKINGITVSGIPFPFYLMGWALAAPVGAYIFAFLDRYATGVIFDSDSLEFQYWTPDAVREVLITMKNTPADGVLATVASNILKIISTISVWTNQFVSFFSPQGENEIPYLQTIKFLRDCVSALIRASPFIAIPLGVEYAGNKMTMEEIPLLKKLPYNKLPIQLLKLFKRLLEFLPCTIGVLLYNRIYKNQQNYKI